MIVSRDAPFCPNCGSQMILKQGGRYDPFFSCSNYPECRETRQLKLVDEVFGVPILTDRDQEEEMIRWLR